MEKIKYIYCCECQKDAKTTLKQGKDVYRGRGEWDLKNFYQCENCNNFVGVHKDTFNPLGVIPTPEFKKIIKLSLTNNNKNFK